MRYDGPVEEAEAGRYGLGDDGDVVHQPQLAEVWTQDAGAGAVTAVDHRVAAQQVDQDLVGPAVSKRATQHENVSAPDPDEIEAGEGLDRSRFVQIHQGDGETGRAELRHVPPQTGSPISWRHPVVSVGHQCRAPTSAQQQQQPLLMRTKTKGGHIQPHPESVSLQRLATQAASAAEGRPEAASPSGSEGRAGRRGPAGPSACRRRSVASWSDFGLRQAAGTLPGATGSLIGDGHLGAEPVQLALEQSRSAGCPVGLHVVPEGIGHDGRSTPGTRPSQRVPLAGLVVLEKHLR